MVSELPVPRGHRTAEGAAAARFSRALAILRADRLVDSEPSFCLFMERRLAGAGGNLCVCQRREILEASLLRAVQITSAAAKACDAWFWQARGFRMRDTARSRAAILAAWMEADPGLETAFRRAEARLAALIEKDAGLDQDRALEAAAGIVPPQRLIPARGPEEESARVLCAVRAALDETQIAAGLRLWPEAIEALARAACAAVEAERTATAHRVRPAEGCAEGVAVSAWRRLSTRKGKA